MRKFVTSTADTCWRDSIACILGVPPSRVPDFVKLYKNEYMQKTHKWLREKYKKGMVYVPSRQFMESGALKFNTSGGPGGYSIGYLSMLTSNAHHAVICKDGEIIWDNGDSREDDYDVLKGYMIIYDLDNAISPYRKKGKKKR